VNGIEKGRRGKKGAGVRRARRRGPGAPIGRERGPRKAIPEAELVVAKKAVRWGNIREGKGERNEAVSRKNCPEVKAIQMVTLLLGSVSRERKNCR